MRGFQGFIISTTSLTRFSSASDRIWPTQDAKPSSVSTVFRLAATFFWQVLAAPKRSKIYIGRGQGITLKTCVPHRRRPQAHRDCTNPCCCRRGISNSRPIGATQLRGTLPGGEMIFEDSRTTERLTASKDFRRYPCAEHLGCVLTCESLHLGAPQNLVARPCAGGKGACIAGYSQSSRSSWTASL